MISLGRTKSDDSSLFVLAFTSIIGAFRRLIPCGTGLRTVTIFVITRCALSVLALAAIVRAFRLLISGGTLLVFVFIAGTAWVFGDTEA